jgi:hypothetical protein
MPSLQTIAPNVRENPLEKTLAAFSQQSLERQTQRQDTDALSNIYKQFQNDKENIQGIHRAIQTDPNLSPTARVNAMKENLEMAKHNSQLQTNVLKQRSLQQKADKEERKQADIEQQDERNRSALKMNNASPAIMALYEAAPVGGQTKIVEDVLENSARNKQPVGLASPDINDYDIGLTPKERVKRQDARFQLQTPLVTANSQALSALQNEELSIGLLNELTDSGKVGEGLHKLNINPKTGDLIIPQLGTPEEQLFVKTVNDFTVKAKDSFGARVTNFELDRFMQRLPTLANSAEGRKLILRQMGIINKLNQMEKQGIQEVFDKYGVRNIDYVDAENLAREKIKGQKEDLRKEYIDLEYSAKKEERVALENIKQHVKPGFVAMRKPDGTIKQFPEKNIPNLEDKGYQRL